MGEQAILIYFYDVEYPKEFEKWVDDEGLRFWEGVPGVIDFIPLRRKDPSPDINIAQKVDCYGSGIVKFRSTEIMEQVLSQLGSNPPPPVQRFMSLIKNLRFLTQQTL